MPSRLFTQHFLTHGIRVTTARRAQTPALAALRASALSLLLVLTLIAAACDVPDETSLTESPAPTTATIHTPTPAVIDVHRDDFGRRPTPSPDRAVLEVLYHATDGEKWTNNTNWLSDAPPGSWHGVTTDSTGRVTHLRLDHNQLRGPIPPELGRLADLEWLDLHQNQLRGTIPLELSRLSNLHTLWLGGNQLAGKIPRELGNLSQLTYLGLDENQLTGAIPAELGNLSSLRSLGLVDNLLSGEIPSWIGSLRNLEALGLAENRLRGSIPTAVAHLAHLNWLTLSDNQLQGTIPPELGNLPHLTIMYIGGSNHFTGCVPEALGAVPVGDVAALGLPYCDLSGRVPTEAGPKPAKAPAAALATDRAALVALYHATDGANWITDTHWLSNAPLGEWHGVTTDATGRVVQLRLPDNHLAGQIPSELGRLEKLALLALGSNQLRGAIPPELGNLSNLRVLTLNKNQLNRTIPPELGRLGSLRWLDLYRNHLSGAIPSELGQLTNLEALDLTENQLTGSIPAEIGWLTKLESLLLHDNQLTGAIPPELGNLTQLGVLELHNNRLSGAVPIQLRGLSRLHLVSLGENDDLTGCVPEAWRTVPHSDIPELGLPFCATI